MKIHDAARSGDIKSVAAELAAGVPIDCREFVSDYTALRCVVAMPDASLEMIHFLLQRGAQISKEVFKTAVQCAGLETIRFLLKAGAKIDERAKQEECGTLAVAAYGRSSPDDTSLIPTLSLLIEHGADVNIVSSYSEVALRIVAGRGRFDAVAFLLAHGADPQVLAWSELMYAIALGTVEEVLELLAKRTPLTDRDDWHRTPWLLSLQGGDLIKAKLVLAAGADRNDRGHCQRTPLMYAVEGHHTPLLEWLLAEGFDVNAVDEFGQTALLVAVEHGCRDCVALLLKAGADASKGPDYTRPIEAAMDIEIVRLLVAAGEDFNDICDEMRRELTGMQAVDPRATKAQYRSGRDRVFGRRNPQRMDNPFWRTMVQSDCIAYHARSMFDDTERWADPVWCYHRFGRTTTLLPDGRIIEVAGEHEDSYDPDFCIYNDVVVFDGKGSFEILGYPQAVFPPTDFHTATLVGEALYLIGNLGYPEQRKPGATPVYRLNCRTFRIEHIDTTGERPGWISKHKAWYEPETDRICIRGGMLHTPDYVPNESRYALNLKTRKWARLS